MLNTIRPFTRTLSLLGAMILLSSTGVAGPAPTKEPSTTHAISPTNTTIIEPTSTTAAEPASTTATESASTHSTNTTSTAIPEPTPTPTPEPPSPECKGYKKGSRLQKICDMFPRDRVKVVKESYWTPLTVLEEKTLYIVASDDDDETLHKASILVSAPLHIPEGSALLPSPAVADALLEIQFKGDTGSSKKCAFCVLEYGEKARVSGVRIDLSEHDLEIEAAPTTAPMAKVRSIVYGETSESEFSDSVLVGDTECDSLIYQKYTNTGGYQYYSGNLLYTNGSMNAIKVVNSSDKLISARDKSKRQVEVRQSIVVLDGEIRSGTMQVGLEVENLVPLVNQVQFVYVRISEKAGYTRTGLYMLDVPWVSISENYYTVSLPQYRRAEDAAEVFAWKRLGKTEAASSSNSYVLGMSDVLGEDDKLTYGFKNNYYYKDLIIDIREESLRRFSAGNWSFHGSALRLNGTLEEYQEKPPGIVDAINSYGEMMGPAPGNGTAVPLEDMLGSAAAGDSYVDRNWKWLFPVTAIGTVIATLAVIGAIKYGPGVARKVCKGRSYGRVRTTDSIANFPDALNTDNDK